MTDTKLANPREYDERDAVDRAIDAFHEIHPLAGNDPLDWPAHFIEGVRSALKAALKVASPRPETMTFIVDPRQSIDEVLPADRRWVIANAIGIVAAYRNCESGETKAVMQQFVDYMRAALTAPPPASTSRLTDEQQRALRQAIDVMGANGFHWVAETLETITQPHIALFVDWKQRALAAEGLLLDLTVINAQDESREREAFDRWMTDKHPTKMFSTYTWAGWKARAGLAATEGK